MRISEIKSQLATVQARARTRKINEDEAIDLVREVALFLIYAPCGTSVKNGLHARVANCYRGTPEGTYVRGHKGRQGEICIGVHRDRAAFGNRAAIINCPTGYTMTGDVHSTGATDDLANVGFERKQKKS